MSGEKSFLFFAIICLTFQVTLTASVAKFTLLGCDDDKILGIDELVQSVQKTLEHCNAKTASKLDFFGCFLKRLDLSQFKEDGKTSVKKIYRFLKGILSSKIFQEVKDFAFRITGCAASYATTRVVDPTDVGVGSGVVFLKCFYDALRKFNFDVRETCKEEILANVLTTTTPSK